MEKENNFLKPSRSDYHHVEYLELVAKLGELYKQMDQLILDSDGWLKEVYLGPLPIAMHGEVQGFVTILDDMVIYANPEETGAEG